MLNDLLFNFIKAALFVLLFKVELAELKLFELRSEFTLCIFDECDGGTGTANCFESCRKRFPCDSNY